MDNLANAVALCRTESLKDELGDTSHRTRNESVPSSVLSRLFPQTPHFNSAQSDWETAILR
jgi:hypothetical protein